MCDRKNVNANKPNCNKRLNCNDLSLCPKSKPNFSINKQIDNECCLNEVIGVDIELKSFPDENTVMLDKPLPVKFVKNGKIVTVNFGNTVSINPYSSQFSFFTGTIEIDQKFWPLTQQYTIIHVFTNGTVSMGILRLIPNSNINKIEVGIYYSNGINWPTIPWPASPNDSLYIFDGASVSYITN